MDRSQASLVTVSRLRVAASIATVLGVNLKGVMLMLEKLPLAACLLLTMGTMLMISSAGCHPKGFH